MGPLHRVSELLSRRGPVRTVTIYVSFVVLAFFIFPLSVKMAFGEELWMHVISGTVLFVGIPAICFSGYDIIVHGAERRQELQLEMSRDLIRRQTHLCVKPQVLGSVVVFSVVVEKRGAPESRWLQLSSECASIDLVEAFGLDGKKDTAGPVRRLMEATFGPKGLHCTVLVGGGRAGPTGLAVAVGAEDFGPSLAATVGQYIHEAMREGITTQ